MDRSGEPSRCPGVYVDGAKVASLGLRIRRGCSYHGLALNVQMDLEPFGRINPCGLIDLRVTQLADLGGPQRVDDVKAPLIERLRERLRARDCGGCVSSVMNSAGRIAPQP